jgi:cytoskeletal protein CcmA (bactofilin family)
MSMRALVDRRVTNRLTQLNNRLVEFTKPVMYNGDLYVNRNLVVSGNEEIKGNLTVHGDLTVTNLHVLNDETIDKRLFVSGDVSLNSRLCVYGDVSLNSRLCVYGDVSLNSKLIVGNDVTIKGRLNVEQYTNSNIIYTNVTTNHYSMIIAEDLSVNGFVQPSNFLPGQVINVTMLSNTEISQPDRYVGAKYNDNIFNFSYTPKYSNSYLIVEYITGYDVGGSNDDYARAYLYVAGSEISNSYQHWIGAIGGGTRSKTIFPLMGRYTNTDTSSKNIAINVYNGTDSDTIHVYSDNSTWLKITEIGR